MLVLEFKRKCSKKRHDAIWNAVMFACNELMPRVRKPFYINIRPIHKLTETQGVNGDCMDEDDREFTIRIDVSLPLNEMISTILHEMVHVQQFLSGKLKQPRAGTAVYKRVDYDWEMNYDDRPWEIEAHSKEKQLAEKYFAGQEKQRSIG